MAAHRYWRLNLPPGDIANGTLLAEVELRSMLGGVSINALAARSGNCPANWFDDNTATGDYKFTGGNYALSPVANFDFGTAMSVVEVYLRSGANGGLVPAYLRIQYSDDGVTWLYMGPPFDTAAMGANSVYLASGFSEVATSARQVGFPARLAPGIPAGNPGTRMHTLSLRYDAVDGGTLSITSDVKISGTPDEPVQRQVLLFEAISMRLVRSTWSNPVTGAYSFPNLKLQSYLALSRDITAYYNAAVADRLTPV